MKGDKVGPEVTQITVDIDRGMKHGHEIRKNGQGDEKVGTKAGDLVFVLHQKPHSKFTRKGPNLEMTQDILLSEALCGCKIVIAHLDGRKLIVSTKPGEVISPDAPKMIQNEGMPLWRSDGKGALIVNFNIIFPLSFSAAEKRVLHCALPSASNPQVDSGDPNVEVVSLATPPSEPVNATNDRKQPSETYDEEEIHDMGGKPQECAQQ